MSSRFYHTLYYHFEKFILLLYFISVRPLTLITEMLLQQSEEDVFMASLICNMDVDCEKLLICKVDMDCIKALQFDTEVTNVTLE